MKIVRICGKAYEQCINFDKSSLFFGKRVSGNSKQTINTLFGSREGGMSSYLGIPVDISGSKCKMFAFLKDMLQNRVNRWSAQWLSKWGTDFLVKSIALALPTYVMSRFFLPLDICEN